MCDSRLYYLSDTKFTTCFVASFTTLQASPQVGSYAYLYWRHSASGWRILDRRSSGGGVRGVQDISVTNVHVWGRLRLRIRCAFDVNVVCCAIAVVVSLLRLLVARHVPWRVASVSDVAARTSIQVTPAAYYNASFSRRKHLLTYTRRTFTTSTSPSDWTVRYRPHSALLRTSGSPTSEQGTTASTAHPQSPGTRGTPRSSILHEVPANMAGQRNYDFLVRCSDPSLSALRHPARQRLPAQTPNRTSLSPSLVRANTGIFHEMYRSNSSSSATAALGNPAACCASAKTASRPVSSRPLASTLRFAPSSSTVSASSCRYGIRPGRSASAQSPRRTIGARWGYS